jgi:hypothetical protein
MRHHIKPLAGLAALALSAPFIMTGCGPVNGAQVDQQRPKVGGDTRGHVYSVFIENSQSYEYEFVTDFTDTHGRVCTIYWMQNSRSGIDCDFPPQTQAVEAAKAQHVHEADLAAFLPL